MFFFISPACTWQHGTRKYWYNMPLTIKNTYAPIRFVCSEFHAVIKKDHYSNKSNSISHEKTFIHVRQPSFISITLLDSRNTFHFVISGVLRTILEFVFDSMIQYVNVRRERMFSLWLESVVNIIQITQNMIKVIHQERIELKLGRTQAF